MTTDANVFRRSACPSTGRLGGLEPVPRRVAAASNCTERRKRENSDNFDESGASVVGPASTASVVCTSPSLLDSWLTTDGSHHRRRTQSQN